MKIGAFVDLLIFVFLGACLIFSSVKDREKLGKKAASIRFVGIGFILIGIIYAIFRP